MYIDPYTTAHISCAEETIQFKFFLSLSSNLQTKDHAAEEILKNNPLGHQRLGLLPVISDIQFLSWSLLQLPLKSVGISLSTSVGAGSGFSHFPLGLARDANVRDAARRAPDGRK